MALSREQIEVLAAKMIEGSITAQEQQQLDSWLDKQLAKESFEVETSFAADADALRERMLMRILAATEERPMFRPIRRLLRWSSVAAAVLLLAFGGYQFFRADKTAEGQFMAGQAYVADIAPGGNRATLTRADGTVVNLDETRVGIVVKDGTVTYDNDATVFTLASLTGGEEQPPVEMLSLTTPKGGTYQLALPDGSRIWLNANSTLRYPSRFTGTYREVDISGEAYFSVQKDMDRPFRVTSNGQTIQVLGTEFNVSAYPGDDETRTTLVEGSVRLEADGAIVELVPGEQGVRMGNRLTKLKVDVEQFVAWKDGYFIFDGLSPETAFTQLARWYDVDVVYRGDIPTGRFFGMIDRNKSLNTILKVLKRSGINFELRQKNGRNQLVVRNQ